MRMGNAREVRLTFSDPAVDNVSEYSFHILDTLLITRI